MTKTIRDFGISIGGRRKKRNVCILEQNAGDVEGSSKNHTEQYFYTDPPERIKEEKGTYEALRKRSKEPDNRKKPLPYSKLDSVCRTDPEYLKDRRHADENDFKELGIRGVEFGVSLSDEEAQSLLDECYVAFCDLARVLKMDKKDISFGGTLSLTFGSRGTGGNGPATYDPKYHVISFTREGREAWPMSLITISDVIEKGKSYVGGTVPGYEG
jgi:hypothetical protein